MEAGVGLVVDKGMAALESQYPAAKLVTPLVKKLAQRGVTAGSAKIASMMMKKNDSREEAPNIQEMPDDDTDDPDEPQAGDKKGLVAKVKSLVKGGAEENEDKDAESEKESKKKKVKKVAKEVEHDDEDDDDYDDVEKVSLDNERPKNLLSKHKKHKRRQRKGDDDEIVTDDDEDGAFSEIEIDDDDDGDGDDGAHIKPRAKFIRLTKRTKLPKGTYCACIMA